jgi:hypothetical protein
LVLFSYQRDKTISLIVRLSCDTSIVDLWDVFWQIQGVVIPW